MRGKRLFLQRSGQPLGPRADAKAFKKRPLVGERDRCACFPGGLGKRFEIHMRGQIGLTGTCQRILGQVRAHRLKRVPKAAPAVAIDDRRQAATVLAAQGIPVDTCAAKRYPGSDFGLRAFPCPTTATLRGGDGQGIAGNQPQAVFGHHRDHRRVDRQSRNVGLNGPLGVRPPGRDRGAPDLNRDHQEHRCPTPSAQCPALRHRRLHHRRARASYRDTRVADARSTPRSSLRSVSSDAVTP
jgi:hypothetical protein